MPRICSICHSDRRADIDAALVGHVGSIRRIAAQRGVSATALRRHRDHCLPGTLTKVAELHEMTRGRDLLAEAAQLQQRVAGILDHAERTADHGLFLKAARELREGLHLLARFQAFALARESTPPAPPRPAGEIMVEMATIIDLARERQRPARWRASWYRPKARANRWWPRRRTRPRRSPRPRPSPRPPGSWQPRWRRTGDSWSGTQPSSASTSHVRRLPSPSSNALPDSRRLSSPVPALAVDTARTPCGEAPYTRAPARRRGAVAGSAEAMGYTAGCSRDGIPRSPRPGVSHSETRGLP